MSGAKMNTRIIAVAIIALIIGTAIGYGVGFSTISPSVSSTATTATATSGLSGTIPIGILLPITTSILGSQALDAAKDATIDVNTWLNSTGAGWQIQLNVQDDGGNPTTGLQKLQILNSAGVKVVVGPIWSSVAAGIVSYANENHIVLISGSTSDALAIGNDYLFRTLPVNSFQMKADVREFRDRGYKAVEGVFINCCACPDFLNIMKNDTSLYGIAMNGLTYDQNTAEFSSQVSQLNSWVQSDINKYGAGKVGVFACSEDELVSILTAARAYPALQSVTWYSTDSIAQNIKILTQDALGVNLTAAAIGATVSPLYDRINAELTKTQGASFTIYSVVGYDNVWLAALSIMAAGRYDGQAVYNVLPSVADHMFGATGWMHLNQYGDREYGTVDLFKVESVSGTLTWVQVGSYDAGTDVTTWVPGQQPT